MGQVFSYSIFSSFLLAVLYVCYKWLLAGEKQYGYNRWMLLSIYAVSLSLPLAFPAIGNSLSETSEEMAYAVISGAPTVEVLGSDSEHVDLPSILLTVWMVGFAASVLFMLWNMWRLWNVIRSGEMHREDDYILVVIDGKNIVPFSWLRYVVMTREDFEESAATILIHERSHLKARHWLDLMFSQLVIAFQWFNPAAWLMLEELKTVHEYQADEAVLLSGADIRQYQMMLMKKAVGARFQSLANSLNHSNLKKRITMMYKNESSIKGRLRSLALVPAAAIAIVVANTPIAAEALSDAAGAAIVSFPSGKVTENKASEQVASTHEQGRTSNARTTAEVMPKFKGGDAELFKFVASNIRYPESAKKNGVNGRVVVRFVVSSTGKVVNPEIVRSVSPELDAEALRVVSLLPDFTPGMSGGKPVDCKYALPIMFNLDKKNSTAAKTSEKTNESNALSTAEVMPKFKGGDAELFKFVASNIRYPESAKKAGIGGYVVIRFVVSATGKVVNPEIVRGRSPELDAEALRVVSLLPDFTPGMSGGKPVDCNFTIPIKFTLD